MKVICMDDVVKFIVGDSISVRSNNGLVKIFYSANGIDPDLIVADMPYGLTEIYTQVSAALPDDFAVNKYKYINQEFIPV